VSHGLLETKLFNEYPFNKKGNVADLFGGKIDTVKSIISAVNNLNARVS
jgi:type I restriction enzyme R subunit